jgi:glucose/arabinose dehydrogenase
MRRRPLAAIVALLTACLTFVAGGERPARAAPSLGIVQAKLAVFATGLQHPLAMAWRKGNTRRVYVAEKSGRIRIVENGHITGTALTLNVSTDSEQGLLGITFSGDGKKLYAGYTDPSGTSRVDEWTMNGAVANPATRRPLLAQPQPAPNHNGGQVTIDGHGMLFIAFGDGGGGADPNDNGQRLSTWLGKILRIDPRPWRGRPYGVPPGNPFMGQPGRRPEIWMYGFRNPWRFSIDRGTGDMWIGDVGHNAYEEVDYAPAGMKGVNWGWNRREGFHPFQGGARPPGARDPILERPHTQGDCSVIGGYVYRGKMLGALRGGYVFGDLCTGKIRAVAQFGGVIYQRRDLGLVVPMLSSFGQGPAGELYAISLGGTIYKIVRA